MVVAFSWKESTFLLVRGFPSEVLWPIHLSKKCQRCEFWDLEVAVTVKVRVVVVIIVILVVPAAVVVVAMVLVLLHHSTFLQAMKVFAACFRLSELHSVLDVCVQFC